MQAEPNGTRNLRNWWPVVSEPYKEAHFATFGKKWIEPCILAGTSEKGCCPECGSPWVRVVEKSGGTTGKSWHDHSNDLGYGQRKNESGMDTYQVTTTGWSPSCSCLNNEPLPATVLDPFAGSGTTGLVAYEHGREFIGIELSPDYCRMAEKRLARATAQGRLF